MYLDLKYLHKVIEISINNILCRKLTRMWVEGVSFSVYLFKVIHHVPITYNFKTTGCPGKKA